MPTQAPPGERFVRIRGTDYPLRLPSRRDPRLHLAATITTIQVLGQAFLGWELSIAQILVCLGTCAVIEIGLVFWESRVFAWPASALLTGNGVALVLRVNGTEHGDWWSMQGWYIFALTSALALLSKHLIRFRGRPVVNPSNLGLVVCFVVLGTGVVNPLDFWWGPLSPSMVAVYLVLTVGAVAVTRRLGLLPMSLAFWGVFAGSLGVLALGGHCISARWSVTPVCGGDFWWVLATSPEVIIFMLFMITDPMTSPREPGRRIMFGASVGLTSALLVAPMQTEFAAKVALLAGLVVVCAIRPLLALAAPRVARLTAEWRAGRPAWSSPTPRVAALGTAALAAPALLLVGAPARHPATPPSAVAVDAAGLEARPVVDLPAGAVPPVEVSDEVRSVIGSGRDDTDAMAEDLVEGLAIEADALADHDDTLAATAVAGPRLEAARAGAATDPAASYAFTALTVVVVRDPEDPQAVPRLGIHAVGSSTTSSGAERPVDSVYVLEDVAGTWLVTDEVPTGE